MNQYIICLIEFERNNEFTVLWISNFQFFVKMNGASMGLISGHSKMFKLANGKVNSFHLG